jgi:xanthine dehydrogenase large subunit
MNGKAVEIACNTLKIRLKTVAAELTSVDFDKIEIKDEKVFANGKETDINWEKLVFETFVRRINLTENGHYATPEIHFDKTKEKGHPFAYHVYGTAVTQITLDCLRGTYEIDSVEIVHDFGESLNLGIDVGQVEGALAQGIGWMTMEEIEYDAEGKLLSNSLSSYKVPDIFSIPKKVDVHPLASSGSKHAILKSKAIGEPPFMYGIGTYFAIQNAVKAFNPKYKLKFNSPFTPEKVLMSLYES